MSTETLKKALQKMPHSGEQGFEGLVKRLLELCLNEQFVLARTGDQPSGDAHNSHRSVCVQAKRYKDKSPQAKNIEGDFDENLRTLPKTDIYILAVTRHTAQLDDTLDAMRKKSAVDVIVWDFGSDDSALPVLCIEHWEDLLEFSAIRRIDPKLNDWAATIRNSKSHKQRLEELYSAIRECTQTHTAVREAARSYLARRFQLLADTVSLPLQPIALRTAVDRARYRKQALEWWSTNHDRILVISAPEGYGKTWVAAQCGWEISEQEDSIVLWLDSLQWRDCASIDAVLTEAVSRIALNDPEKTARLVRKLRERWSKQTLIILDGVSERNALPAAQKILEDLSAKHPGTCRVIFTTRPLESVASFNAILWRRGATCKVEPFDDAEFTRALTQAEIPPGEITEHLRSVARIPRYFTTCLRLRSRLKQLGTQISETDASLWVRWHAEWAKEVSAQERSARSLLRRVLHEVDPYKISAGLQVLKPALTPVARWWASGAHLYGFPSPDSDFDLRGAHVLPLEKVVGLEERDETLEDSRVIEGMEMDIVSHDVRKFFGLLLKKNGYVLEQLFSPLIVQTTPEHEELKAICSGKSTPSPRPLQAAERENFSQRLGRANGSGVITRHHSHHYFGFAETQWKLFEKENPRRVKPLLYVFRVLLTGIHLMRTGEVNANLVELNEEFRLPYIADLVARKQSGENTTLQEADVAFYQREYARLRIELQAAHDASQLPELPSDETRAALNDLLVRIRLKR